MPLKFEKSFFLKKGNINVRKWLKWKEICNYLETYPIMIIPLTETMEESIIKTIFVTSMFIIM